MPWDFMAGISCQELWQSEISKKPPQQEHRTGLQAQRQEREKKNAARTLRRAFKKTLWPELYWCRIPMKSKKNNKKALMWHAFQLPHEWMAVFFADPAALARCQPAQGSKTWVAAKEIKQKLGWGEEAVIPFALHGDGVPVQGTMRKEGLDFLTINLPAAQDAKHRSPVPFTLLQTDFHWEYETKDSTLKVLLWSMQCLKEGKFPSCRHDGSPWLKSDKQRRTYVGRDLPAKGILVEIRGDWDWLNSWYNIPTYNTKSGMCWLCKTTFETFRNCTANERNSGLSKAEFLTRVRNMGKTVCPLWHWPEMAPRTLILPDWLHAVDMGISADIAGQLLLELSAKYEGRSLKDRVSGLWLDVQELYKEHMVTDRLQKLTPEVLNKGKKSTGPPTLKCPAATVRHLVPLLPILTGKHFAIGSDHEVACHKLAKFLAKVYNKVETNEHSGLDKASAKVASQYMALEKEALEAEDSLNWHVMPKLHQFQHICESNFNAKDFWCYADETLGGHLAQLFLRRGGANNPGENCARALEKWQQIAPFPAVARP